MKRGNPSGDPSEDNVRLDRMFKAYRIACSPPNAGADFMPTIWAKIEAQQDSVNWFGRVAKTLVTAALAASVILALMISAMKPSGAFYNATFVEALRANRAAALDPLRLDRISESALQ